MNGRRQFIGRHSPGFRWRLRLLRATLRCCFAALTCPRMFAVLASSFRGQGATATSMCTGKLVRPPRCKQRCLSQGRKAGAVLVLHVGDDTVLSADGQHSSTLDLQSSDLVAMQPIRGTLAKTGLPRQVGDVERKGFYVNAPHIFDQRDGFYLSGTLIERSSKPYCCCYHWW